MTKQQPWFVEERAVAFASLMLTKHNDVIVRPHTGPDRGVDLLVEILKDGKSMLRFFGVQLVGCMALPGMEDTDKRAVVHLTQDHVEATLPLCVFVIDVRKPEGIYRWVVAPVIDDGRAVLSREVAPDWRALDEAGVSRLIGQVDAWYDALQV